MTFQQAVTRVTADASFIPEDGYLVHGFFSEGTWQVGFYNADDDRITAYVAADFVTRQTPEQVFKQDATVPALRLEDVQLSLEDAEGIARTSLETNHPGHPATKLIVLVQTINGVACYNITVVTATLHMYNIKIDASSGAVVSELFDSIMSLKAE